MRFPRPIAVALVLLGAGRVFGADLAHDFAVRRWRPADGLPSDEVDAIGQDRAGYLWIATSAGVARFDGSHFAPVPLPEHGGTSPARCNALTVDRRGTVLVAPSSGGVLRFNGDRFEPYPLPGTLAQRVFTGLFSAPDGALWVASGPGAAIRIAGNAPRTFDAKDGIPADQPVQFAHDGYGAVWLAAGPWLARFEHDALKPLVPRGRKDVLRIASSRDDGPWILSDRYLFKYAGDEPVPITTIDTKTSSVYLHEFFEASDGMLWLAARSRGVSCITADGRQHVVVPAEDVACVMQDRDGEVWAGGRGGGLVRLKPAVLAHYDRSNGLTEDYSLSLAQSSDGTMWFANRDGGVVYLTPSGHFLPMERTGDNWKYFSAYTVNPANPGGMWVTSSRGLIHLGGTQVDGRISTPHGVHSRDWRVALTARDGALWVALEPGKIGRLSNGAWAVLGTDRGVGEAPILAIAQDAANRIWIGDEHGRVARLEGKRFVEVPLPGADTIGAVQAMLFDAADGCWIGTERGGLLHLDVRGAHAVTTADGLPVNDITQLAIDSAGRLWCGSRAGIFYCPRADVLARMAGHGATLQPVSLGPDDGLPQATCSGGFQPSVWNARDGRLWFTTRQGVVAVDPAKLSGRLPPLRTRILSVACDGRPAAWRGAAEIPPNPRSLDLTYSVLCLAQPDRVRSRHRLLGYDDDWVDDGRERSAHYTRLPPGEYRFEISAHLIGAPGSEVTQSLRIAVARSWTQTVAFRIASALAAVLLVAFAARTWSHRRLRARLAQLERDSALERERARIAQNIHDDLGAGLTRISLLTQTTRLDDSRLLLDKIYGTVSEITQSMQEIVWAVNPKNDDLERMGNYLAEYAQEYLTDAQIACRVQLPEMLPERPVTAHYRHELFLSCKEALHNVVKHAAATEVTLRIELRHAELWIAIADNGRGFASADTAAHRGGNGLANLRARLAALGGRCEIAATEAGVIVTLVAPLPEPNSVS